MRDYDGTPLGVVHRDVSPQNLFITYDGQVKVLDFGIAKGSLNVSDTQSGVLKGKVSYMAPEQASEGEVDRRSDIFSMGVVLWELLTGDKLFKGDTVAALRAVAHDPIEPPSAYAAGISPDLEAIVMKALARSPNGRFGTALAMSNALSDWLLREGHVIRREDVAQHMQRLFAGAREAMAKRVQAYMVSRTSDVPPFSDPAGPLSGVRAAVKRKSPLVPFVAASFAVGLVAAATFVVVRTKSSSTSSKDPLGAAVTGELASNRADTEQTFHLTLSSDPPEATVEWGGNVVGQTPMLIDLSPGPQTFILSRDGYFKATVVLNVTDGMTGRNESRTVVLVPRPKGRAPGATPALPARPGAPMKGGASGTLIAPPAAAPQPANTPPPEAAGGTLAAPAAAVLPPPPAPAAPAAAQAPAPAKPSPVAEAPTPPPAAAAPPAAPAVLPFGPEMTRPTLLSGSELVTPREALVAGVSGTVIAKCTITTEGALRNCRIIKGLPYLDKAMLDMLATRRYSPVLYQGKPVSVEYVFNLKVAPH
jgi:hypothetical protein